MILDVVFGILLLTGLMRGLRRGFAGQVIHVGGLVLGVMFAGTLAKYGGPHAEPYIARVPAEIRPAVLQVASLLLIVLVVWIVCGISLTRYRLKTTGVPVASGQDRIFGAILGLLTNAVVIALLIEGIQHLPNPLRDAEIVKTQLHQSLAVQWSQKVPVANWISKLPEVQELFASIATIADHYRPGEASEPDAAEELKKVEDDLLHLPE